MVQSNNTRFSIPPILPSAQSIIHKKQSSLGEARTQGYKSNLWSENNSNAFSIENEESIRKKDIESVSGKFD